MSLSVNGIEFSYNGYPTLHHIDFELEAGEILGILGVNGAGKSTLLKCINKILTPKHGTVYLNGIDLLSLDNTAIAKHLAYVPQSHFKFVMTVFDYVLMGRKPHIKWHATEKDYHITESILCQMKLEKFAERSITEISGGEMQKVIISRALAQEPEILILDEPTSSLDLKNQYDVMTMIRDIIREQKISAIISIHDLNLALRFADRFLIIKDNSSFLIKNKEELSAKIIRDVYGLDVSFNKIEGHTVIVPV